MITNDKDDNGTELCGIVLYHTIRIIKEVKL